MQNFQTPFIEVLNYYDILHINEDANLFDIKKAYRSAAMFWHPDKNNSSHANQKFIDVTEAYNILINPNRKMVYDTILNEYLKTNKTNQIKDDNTTSHFEYQKWVQEERIKAQKLLNISVDKILTDTFYFIDQYGWGI